ncbi:hypothetical protein ACFL3I_00850 [Pseudomonadota bacterium]
MNSSVASTRPIRPVAKNYQQVMQKIPLQLWVGALLGALLLAAPRSRVVFGAPIYFIDVLAFTLIIMPLKGQLHRWAPKIPISKVVPVFMAAVVISELRGLLVYGTVLESVYMTARYMIAASLFFTIPRLVSKPQHIDLLLKGLILGTLASAVIVILYSLGPTRSLIVGALFSNSLLNPGWERLLRAIAIYGAGESAMRGRSLVGAATMTAGFLALTWPLAFVAYDRFKNTLLWKRIALATVVIAPIGILMTYGRGAWLMVIVVVLLVGVFGLVSGRKILLAVVIGGGLAATQMDIDMELFYFDRITESTQETMDNPFSDVSTTERLLSFIQPFGHLVENPSWLLAGSGRAGQRATRRGNIGGQLYDEVGLANHSAFSTAYYSFGVPAVVCQVLFVALGFLFTMKRAFRMKAADPHQKVVWQGLFMCWCTYSLWWASGHAVVGEPRGMMLSFLLFGLIVAFEKLRLIQLAEMRNKMGAKAH